MWWVADASFGAVPWSTTASKAASRPGRALRPPASRNTQNKKSGVAEELLAFGEGALVARTEGEGAGGFSFGLLLLLLLLFLPPTPGRRHLLMNSLRLHQPIRPAIKFVPDSAM